MTYKCVECGHIFEEGEEYTWYERHGCDAPPYEEWSGCPICKSHYEEAKICAICKGAFLEDELHNDICDDCLDGIKFEHRYDMLSCYNSCASEKEDVSINKFLAYMFKPEEIEEILMQQLVCVAASYPVDCYCFIEDNEDMFIEYIVKEAKENENKKK